MFCQEVCIYLMKVSSTAGLRRGSMCQLGEERYTMTGREIRKDKDTALHFGVWQGAITGGRKQTGRTPLKLDLYGLNVRK